jgi:hypothetical protein
MVRTALALLVALLALGPLAAPAAADPLAVIDDCQDGVIDDQHSRADLRDAKREIQGDVSEYYNCAELIDGALKPTGGGEPRGGEAAGAGATGGGGAAGGGGVAGAPAGGTALAPDDPAAYADANGLRRDASGVPVDAEGRQVDPGSFAPETARALDQARRGVDVAAAGVRPPDDAGTRLPTPLVVLLVAGVVAALGALGPRAARLRRPRSALLPRRRTA